MAKTTLRAQCTNHSENWDAFFVSIHIKEARKYHLTARRVASLYNEYEEAYHEAMLDDVGGYLTFDEWLAYKRACSK